MLLANHDDGLGDGFITGVIRKVIKASYPDPVTYHKMTQRP